MKYLKLSHLNLSKKIFLIPILFLVLMSVVLIIGLREKPIVIQPENISETKYWQTYSNPEFNFSFKYPEGLLSNFSEDKIGNTTKDLLAVTSEIKKQNLNSANSPYQYNVHFGADAWKYDGEVDKFLEENLKETKNLKRQKIILKKFDGIRITNAETKSDAYFIYYLFKTENFIYNFALFSDDPVLLNGNISLLEQILSTARFK